MGDRVRGTSEGLGEGETMRNNFFVALDRREACDQLITILDRMDMPDFIEALTAAMLIHSQHVQIKLTPVKRAKR